MISPKDFIKLHITKSEIINIIKGIFSNQIHKRDNLRTRSSNVQFDCILRGYIGELALKKWFKDNGIDFLDSNLIDDKEGNMDIDLLFKGKSKDYKIEVKTSLIPDYIEATLKNSNEYINRITSAIEKCDIKLIKRGDCNINELKGDIHLQIYFADYRKKKDIYLSNNFIVDMGDKKFNIIDDSVDFLAEKIYDAIFAKSYIDRTYFVAWIDKDTLVNQINNKNPSSQTWSFKGSSRVFWRCNIKKEAKKPIDLITFLKELK